MCTDCKKATDLSYERQNVISDSYSSIESSGFNGLSGFGNEEIQIIEQEEEMPIKIVNLQAVDLPQFEESETRYSEVLNKSSVIPAQSEEVENSIDWKKWGLVIGASVIAIVIGGWILNKMKKS